MGHDIRRWRDILSLPHVRANNRVASSYPSLSSGFGATARDTAWGCPHQPIARAPRQAWRVDGVVGSNGSCSSGGLRLARTADRHGRRPRVFLDITASAVRGFTPCLKLRHEVSTKRMSTLRVAFEAGETLLHNASPLTAECREIYSADPCRRADGITPGQVDLPAWRRRSGRSDKAAAARLAPRRSQPEQVLVVSSRCSSILSVAIGGHQQCRDAAR